MSKRCLNLLALLLGLLLLADAAPYQELEPREGYVPVYIREGDTPLLEINPKLAEAFNEIDTRNLLEAAVDQNSEQKPDLILMSVDGGEPVLIAQSSDQLMSENEQPAALIAIVPVPESESQDDSADIPQANADEESILPEEVKEEEEEEEGEAPQIENNSMEVEETKKALKELVAVLEEKLDSTVFKEKPQLEDDKEQDKIDELTDDHIPEDQATDVSSVDAFKTKEIDVKSVETESIDVPEEQTPDAVSTDE